MTLAPDQTAAVATPDVGPVTRRPRHLAASPAVRFASVAAQLALVLLLLRAFDIEAGYGLPRLLPLIFVGFLVHAALPLRWRTPFFVLLSWAALALLLGFPHAPGLVVLGLGLLAVCHLPVPFHVRVALLLAAGVALAVVRAEWIRTPWTALPSLVLPLLASMFMFRLAVYLYDLRHGAGSVPLAQRLAYFFLLPNACFLLFPVVDFRAFRSSWYDGEASAIYQKGVLWILRGLTHLLLYRLVYHHLVLSPAEVVDLAGVARYAVSLYLLYLRISGQFHVIVGILCLFGYNLPETHHLYYLASSFTDFWRRINIYWKDFMTKLFYYPAFVRLKGRGIEAGVAVATLFVFASTWLLHSYQWFWLRGSFPITAPDAAFWGLLGVLVVVNALRELRHGRARSLGAPRWSLRRALRLSLRTLGMFVLLALLWSLWSSSSVGEWLDVMSAARLGGIGQVLALAGVLAGLVAAGVATQYAAHRGWPLTATGDRPGYARSLAYTVAVGGFLSVVALSEPEPSWAGPAAPLLASIRDERISQRDRARLERGYYEGLLAADRYASALARVNVGPEEWRPIWESDAVRLRDDVLLYELVPGYEGAFKGSPLTVNAWGMRDDSTSLAKPPGTLRIALLGASYEMATGVRREDGFEAVVEARLNADPIAGARRVEVLNFSVGGYSPVQNAVLARQRVFDFAPDLVLLAVPSNAERRTLDVLVQAVQRGVEVREPGLRRLLATAGVSAEMAEPELRRRLGRLVPQATRWSLETVASESRSRRVPAALLYVPQTTPPTDVEEAARDRLFEQARAAGLPVLSLEHAFEGRDPLDIRVAEWDEHPNAEGHRLLADALEPLLRDLPALRDAGRPAAAEPPSRPIQEEP